MHFARVEMVHDESDSYTVSFVKRNSDGSYSWPDKDDRSTVQSDEVVIVKSPAENISSLAGARAVRIKLIFDPNDIESSHRSLDIPLSNIH